MRVAITGAAGRIGSEIVEELSGAHELRLVDRSPVPGRASVVADLGKSPRGRRPPRWTETFEGANVVLHLAADARSQAPWELMLRDNIQATWNVIKAAAKHNVRRVVFASSNWAVKAIESALAPSCYTPGGPKIGSDVSPQPLKPYGVSKAFGELTGHMFVDEGQIASFVAVRIGYYRPDPPDDENLRRLWIGAQDLRSLLRCCVEAEFEGFHVVYGTSAQSTSPYDLSYTSHLLSWQPRQLP